jgi:two-component system chemotaxis sensor kinase CheA
MNLIFDIAQDELDLLLAEADEHLQVLDTILVRLEQHGSDRQLLDSAFRAAHNLKGMAGLIHHWRMVDLTHALETVLDNLRRQTLAITTPVVDTCLEALDALKLLRDEIITREDAPVDIPPLVAQLHAFTPAPAALAPEPAVAPEPSPAAAPGGASIAIEAEFAEACAIPAVRAFQVLLALQGLGSVYDLEPSQAAIEAAAPVRRLTARLVTEHPVGDIRAAVTAISDLARVVIGGESIPLAPAAGGPDGLGLAAPRPADHPGPEDVPALARPAPSAPPNGARARTAEKTVRTSVERLDNLMNLVGELITDRNRLTQLRSDFDREGRSDETVDHLGQAVTHLGRITDQLQEEVMRLRLVPIANVFNKFPRLVRDLAHKAEKQAETVICGADTELDRSVVEEIGDPLIHLLRNAVDHGLETPAERAARGKPVVGAIRLTARHEDGHVILTVEDDGCGIDRARVTASALQKGLLTEAEAAQLSPAEALDLIFQPGLSTAPVVSDVSGRGMGMNIVRTNIERLNGSISVTTQPGLGTCVEIVLPLTLAIMPTLLVEAGTSLLALPLSAVVESLRLPAHAIHLVGDRPVTYVRQQVLPLVSLSRVLALPAPRRANGARDSYAVSLRWGKLEMGLLVDALIGEQELVVKSLGALVGDIQALSGAAILGDGRIALILDVPGLFKLAMN